MYQKMHWVYSDFFVQIGENVKKDDRTLLESAVKNDRILRSIFSLAKKR